MFVLIVSPKPKQDSDYNNLHIIDKLEKIYSVIHVSSNRIRIGLS